MMKKITALICILVFAAALGFSGCAQQDLRTVKVAYACKPELDEESPDSAIGFVEHKLLDASGERLYLLTLQLALYDPDVKGLVSPFPDNTIIRGVKLDESGVAHVTYTDAYASLDGMSRTLAELCTLYTLCQFPEVEGVRIYVGDEGGEILRPEGILTSVDSLRVYSQSVTLYYPSAAQDGLVEVRRDLTLSEADLLSENVVEALISGHRFDTGFRRHIAKQTRCLSAQVKSRVCYVNLSAEFLDLNVIRDDGVNLTVYSIVDSLCLLDPIDRVQFQIEGETAGEGIPELFAKPLEPDYSLVVTE